ncbi:MAG: hypothetical protein ABIW76_21155, partial [Fibrobacteria bacterium]
MAMMRLVLAWLLWATVFARADDSEITRAPDRIMVLRADGPTFHETVKGLMHELGSDFTCEEMFFRPGAAPAVLPEGKPAGALVGKSSEGIATAEQLEAAISTSRPRALVLMDNDAIRLYASVQRQWRDSVPFPPSISLMAVRVDREIAKLQRATGIFYEVPGVTILVNLRSLVTGPVRKVGVIVRPSMADFVRENAK